jgi:hypothetical protein
MNNAKNIALYIIDCAGILGPMMVLAVLYFFVGIWSY